MKKYLALGLLSSLLLTSCSVDWNDAKEKRIGELEKIAPIAKKENISTWNMIVSWVASTGNIVETGTKMILPTVINTGSGIKPLDMKHSPFISSLLEIEKNGITVPLIDEKEFNTFVSDNSGSEFIGNEEDWKSALSLSCKTATGTSEKLRQYDFALDLDRICLKESTDNNAVKELFIFLHQWIKDKFSSEELNMQYLKSNSNSNPTSPLERLVASQVLFGGAIQRFISVRPYKNEILTLYATSMEPWIPNYRVARIYLDDQKLYTKDSGLVDKFLGNLHEELDIKYGKRYSRSLMNDSYEIESGKEKKINIQKVNGVWKDIGGKEFDPEEVRLLKWNWVKNPSIINKRIEEQLIKDFNNF